MQLISSNIFPEGFYCKNITNIILDYSEDYKPKFDEVIHEFERFLYADRSCYQNTNCGWLCYGMNVNYYIFNCYREFDELYNDIQDCLLNRSFINKLMVMFKIDKKIKEYSKELRNTDCAHINALVDKYRILLKEMLKKNFEKYWSQFLKKID